MILLDIAPSTLIYYIVGAFELIFILIPMIIRLILLIVVVTVVLWLLKRLFAETPETEQIESPEAKQAEDMRQCKFCGTHVPESLVVVSNDQPYCSQDHADRDQS